MMKHFMVHLTVYFPLLLNQISNIINDHIVLKIFINIEFVSDTILWMKGNKIPFVTKYSGNMDSTLIPGARSSLKSLMSKSLCKRVTSQAEFLEYL